MPASPSTMSTGRKRSLAPRVALAVLAVFIGYTMWSHAPRDPAELGFVQIGPEDDRLNLPLASFHCAPERAAPGSQLCERDFEGRRLRVRVAGSFNSGIRCSAQYAGRAYACLQTAVHRGYPEAALRIEDALGTSAERRRVLRLLDPLSHAAEGDWGLPSWLFALIFAGVCTRVTQRFLHDVRRWLRLVLVAATALISTAFGLALAFVLLLWLGYID